MTKERPILFSTPMVQAILSGRKTQTRRRVKKNEPIEWLDEIGFTPEFVADPGNFFCPYGKPGDLLWVRETWLELDRSHIITSPYVYKANTDAVAEEARKDYIKAGYPYQWRPSIYMPKAAARIWLEITEISVERLQDISEEDAIAEGIKTTWINDDSSCNKFKNYINNGKGSLSPKDSFRSLWESINGAESWDLNPWLWVVKFKVFSTTGKEAIQ